MNATKLKLNIMLQLEGLGVFLGAIAVYYALNGTWWLFALLLLAPDLAMLGYLVDKKVGATSYNLIHWYLLPGILFAIGILTTTEIIMQFAVIWFAHIGMDRTIGYGLKYPSDFKDTHLQRV